MRAHVASLITRRAVGTFRVSSPSFLDCSAAPFLRKHARVAFLAARKVRREVEVNDDCNDWAFSRPPQVTAHSPEKMLSQLNHHRCSLRLQTSPSLPPSAAQQPHRVRAAVDAGRAAHLSVGSVMGGRLNTLPTPPASSPGITQPTQYSY